MTDSNARSNVWAGSVADWAAPDTVIEYAIAGGKLVRRDLAAATELPIAVHVNALEASAAGADVNVQLTAGFRDTSQELTLQLEGL